ncbi:MAG: OmpA family protein, partial [Vicingus serpentipes]|nr:OmpA family protein [Vicingus serpentipes]
MLFAFCFTQNIVNNGSFEDISLCPDNQGQISRANYWNTANSNTPDLYNSCNGGSYGVPTNFFGYKEAKTGNGYAGIYTYLQVDQREYLQVSLKDSL